MSWQKNICGTFGSGVGPITVEIDNTTGSGTLTLLKAGNRYGHTTETVNLATVKDVYRIPSPTGLNTVFPVVFGDGSSFTTGNAACTAVYPGLTCVTNGVRTFASPALTVACSTVEAVPFMVSCQ